METFTILSAQANELVVKLHDCMAVISKLDDTIHAAYRESDRVGGGTSRLGLKAAI